MVEEDYISKESCCEQLLYTRPTLLDHEIKFDEEPLTCYDESVMKITTNSVQQSRTITLILAIASLEIIKPKGYHS
jgi:hypothetical protein